MTSNEWNHNEPVATLATLQMEEFVAVREDRLTDYEDMLERLIAMFGSERNALVAVSRAAAVTMLAIAEDPDTSDAGAVSSFLTTRALLSLIGPDGLGLPDDSSGT
jgi:hypothetical protein